MKSKYLMALVAFVLFSLSSCNLDNPLDPGSPGEIEPIVLKDRYDEDVLLTNHNKDGIDYIATSEIEIYNGKMSIEPGVTISFEEGASFIVGIEGEIEAKGTAAEPIRMIGDKGEPSWSGIYINSDKSNNLEHLIIEHAGRGKSYGVFNDYKAAITLDGRVTIENVTISKSGEMGVVINDSNASDIESFSGNTIKDVASYPIVTNINYLNDLDLADNTFSNNGKNMVFISDYYANRMTKNTELSGLQIPYFFSGQFEIYANLTLNKGVEIVMDQNSQLDHSAGDDYRFEINGTPDDHVVIRGAESENGYWKGLYVTSENNGNVFEYLDISDGGGDKLTFGEGKANIALEMGGQLTLKNSTSTRSGSCEIFVSNFGKEPILINESPAITSVCVE